VVAEAQAVAQRSGAHFWDAELKRLEAALLLASDRTRTAERKAEACLTAAVGLAREQGARLLVLRATTELARLWGRRGRAAEARAALAAAYAEVGERSDARDVDAASAVMEELDGEGARSG
jgi:predicted ATPase